jgi:acyl carrier protein
MEERLALTAHSRQQLLDKLAAYVAGEGEIDELYRGQVRRNQEALRLFAMDEELHEAVEKWIERKKYRRLLAMWAKGLNVDWRKLYGADRPRRISLPTYPFAAERYWVSAPTAAPATSLASLPPPLIQQGQPVAAASPSTEPAPSLVSADLPTIETILSLPDDKASRRVMLGLTSLIARTVRRDIADHLSDLDEFAQLPISHLGIDSVGAMELRARLQSWVDVDLPSHLLIGSNSVGEVVEIIRQKVLVQQLKSNQPCGGAAADDDQEILML